MKSNILRTALVVAVDVAAVAGGARWLWDSGVQTTVDGPLLAHLMLVVATASILAIRAQLIGRTEGPTPNRSAVSIDRSVIMIELLAMAILAGWWLTSSQYYLGWQLTYATVLGVVAASLQLLVDVTTGRNRGVPGRFRSLLWQRLSTLEVWRLAWILAAFSVLAATSAIHRWNPSILNPLVLLMAAAIALGVPLRHGLRRLIQRRSSLASTASDPAKA